MEKQKEQNEQEVRKEKEEQTPSEKVEGGREIEQVKVKEENVDYKDRYLRIYAEFENFKKRSLKEKAEWIQLAEKDILVSLLEVMDDCQRAQEELEKDDSMSKERKEGILLVFQKLQKVIEQRGVFAIEAMGTDFDTTLHEAISEVPVKVEDQKGKIIAEVQKGYKLGEHMLRYAKVVIGK